MSESEQSGAGRREVAYRLFAAEFDDADFSYSESDEERAPNYVITPTGGRVNRLFVVGVLTEVEEVSEDVLRARVVDPTGAFVLYAGQYQPDEQAFLDGAQTPMFVALTGKARTFQPDDSNQVFTSVRPESISEVDAETRDRWTVQTAEQTLERIGHMATGLSLDVRGDDLRRTLEDNGVDDGLAAGIPLAIDHYGTTGAYLSGLRETALDAARLVAGELGEVSTLSMSPGDGDNEGVQALADADIEASVSATAVADATTESAESEPSHATETVDSTETETEPTTAGADDSTTTTQSPTTDVDESTATAAESVETTTTADAESTETAESDALDSEPEDQETVDAPTAAAGGAEESAAATATTDADVETTVDETTATDETAEMGTEGDDIGDFEPGEFDLDEEEREEIEEEYGTEFQSGTDVPEPGEADIETPDPEELAEAEAKAEAANAPADPSPESATEPGPAESATPEPSDTESDSAESTTEDDSEASAPAEGVDLEDATIEVMTELDDGDGANRETLIETVAQRYDASPDDVEDAIQDALMGGRCYEPDDTTVKPI
jgi:RPA family protein